MFVCVLNQMNWLVLLWIWMFYLPIASSLCSFWIQYWWSPRIVSDSRIYPMWKKIIFLLWNDFSIFSVYMYKQNHSYPSLDIQRACQINVIVVPPGFSISVVRGCLLKGSVSEFNKWRVMTALSIILPLVGRMTGSRMSVIISGSETHKTHIYNYKPCFKVALLTIHPFLVSTKIST